MFKSGRTDLFLFMAVIGLLVFLHVVGISLPAENALMGGFSPVMKKLYSWSMHLRSGLTEESDKQSLAAQVKQLESRIND